MSFIVCLHTECDNHKIYALQCIVGEGALTHFVKSTLQILHAIDIISEGIFTNFTHTHNLYDRLAPQCVRPSRLHPIAIHTFTFGNRVHCWQKGTNPLRTPPLKIAIITEKPTIRNHPPLQQNYKKWDEYAKVFNFMRIYMYNVVSRSGKSCRSKSLYFFHIN